MLWQRPSMTPRSRHLFAPATFFSGGAMLSGVVDQLVEGRLLSHEGEVVAEALRSAAELADDPDATPAGRLRAQQSVLDLLDRWAETAGGPALPRIGALHGDQARIVALGLGFERPETVNVGYFDAVDALRLRRDRRRAGLPEHPGLEAIIADRIERAGEMSDERAREQGE